MNRFCLATYLAMLISYSHGIIAADPLDHFRVDADVVIRLKSPETTIRKTVELADAVEAGFGKIVEQNASSIGKAISLPTLDGVDLSRDWFCALYFDPAESTPTVVFGIPAKDTDELVAALPERMTSRVAGDWVLYSESDSGIPDAVDSSDRITAMLNGELSGVVDRGDVSVFINAAHLTEIYREQLDAAHEQATEALLTFSGQVAELNGIDASAITTMYGAMLDGSFTLLHDTEAWAMALSVDTNGIDIEEYATFSDGSATSVAISGHPTSAMESLDRLPPDAVGFMGFRGDMKWLTDLSMSMTESMLPDDAEYREKFRNAWDAWKEIELGEIAGSFSVGSPAEGLFRYSALAFANDIPTVRATMRSIGDSFPTIEQYGVKQTITLQPDFEEIGDRSIDLMTIEQEFEPRLDPTGMQQQMQRMMFGPDGLAYRIAYLDDSYVMTVGGGRAQMEVLLQSMDGSPHGDMDQHRSGLIAEPNILVLGDVTRFAVAVLRTVADFPGIPLPVDSERIDALEFEPSFVGFSLAAEPGALRTKTVIPVEQMRGVRELVDLFR